MFKYYTHLKANRSRFESITFDRLIELVRTPNDNVIDARIAGKPSQQYDRIKEKQVHCYYPNEYQGRSTGFIYLDIDDFLTTEAAIAYRKSIVESPSISPYLAACWLSLSNRGLSILAKVEGLTYSNYGSYWSVLNNLLDNVICTHSKGFSKPNCISFDPTVFVNPNPISFKIEETGGGFSIPLYSKGGNDKEVLNPPELVPVYWSTQLNDREFENINTPVVYPDGKDFLKVDLMKYRTENIKIGSRQKTIGAINLVLLAINPNATRRQLFNAIYSINLKYCVQPLSKKEIINIFNANYKQFEEQGIDVSKYTVKKFVWYHKDCQLPNKDRISFSKTAMNRIKGVGKEATQQVIYDTIEMLMLESNPITRTAIVDLTSLSESTVKRYWKPFKSIIDEHNKRVKEKGTATVMINDNGIDIRTMPSAVEEDYFQAA